MATTDTITLKIAPASISRQVITVATGDYGYTVPFIVQDADGDAQNLTGYTVTLHVWLPATPTTLVIDETCTQDTPASGTRGTLHRAIHRRRADERGVVLHSGRREGRS